MIGNTGPTNNVAIYPKLSSIGKSTKQLTTNFGHGIVNIMSERGGDILSSIKMLSQKFGVTGKQSELQSPIMLPYPKPALCRNDFSKALEDPLAAALLPSLEEYESEHINGYSRKETKMTPALSLTIPEAREVLLHAMRDSAPDEYASALRAGIHEKMNMQLDHPAADRIHSEAKILEHIYWFCDDVVDYKMDIIALTEQLDMIADMAVKNPASIPESLSLDMSVLDGKIQKFVSTLPQRLRVNLQLLDRYKEFLAYSGPA